MNKRNILGFTLIELLISIAIIGMLVAIIFFSISGAYKRGRVTKRITDLKQVQSALEFYYSTYHSYPSTGGVFRGDCSGYGSFTANNTIPGLAPTYIPVVPIDPQTSDPTHCYIYKSDGTDWAFVDNDIPELYMSVSPPNYASYPELFDLSRVNGTSAGGAWKVYSPGGVSW